MLHYCNCPEHYLLPFGSAYMPLFRESQLFLPTGILIQIPDGILAMSNVILTVLKSIALVINSKLAKK